MSDSVKPKVLRSQISKIQENEKTQKKLLEYREILEKNGLESLTIPVDNEIIFDRSQRYSKRGKYIIPEDPDSPLVVIAKKHLKAMLDEMIQQITDEIPFEIVEDAEPKKVVKKKMAVSRKNPIFGDDEDEEEDEFPEHDEEFEEDDEEDDEDVEDDEDDEGDDL